MVAVLAVSLMACGGDEDAADATAIGGVDSDGAAIPVADDADEHHDEDEDHDEDEAHDDDEAHDEDEAHDDEAGSSGGLGAHEHGVAELAVAWSEGDMVVDLVSPTYNIFGFEYEPSTDADRALVADRTDALAQPGVIVVNEEAGCDLAEEVFTELEFDGGHAELTASWLFTCERQDEIRQLDVTALFAEFPNLEDVDAQWVSDSVQGAAELSPSDTVLGLE